MNFTLLNVFGLLNIFNQWNERERRNIVAFAKMVAWAEGMYEDELKPRGLNGQNGWNVKQHYGTFDFNRLPNGCNEAPAIGKFQIEGATWCDIMGKTAKPTPENQSKAFIEILKRQRRQWTRKDKYGALELTSAYDDVLKGDFERAIKKIAGRWSSMPGSRNPPARSYTIPKCIAYIKSQGGIQLEK